MSYKERLYLCSQTNNFLLIADKLKKPLPPPPLIRSMINILLTVCLPRQRFRKNTPGLWPVVQSSLHLSFNVPHTESLARGEASAQPASSNKLPDKSTDVNFVFAAAASGGFLLGTKINRKSGDVCSFSSEDELVFIYCKQT